MRHVEGFLQAARGEKIYYQSWLPDHGTRAAVLLVHGLAEHSGRYSRVVEHLVPQGFALFGFDHVGHGQSEGTRVYVKAFSCFIEALHQMVNRVQAYVPAHPAFLYGHSLGALIAAVYLLEHPATLDGAILSAPCVKVPANISPATVFLARILSRIVPKLSLASVDSSGISRIPEEVQAYIDDPLVYCGKTTARLGAEMLYAMQRVEAEAPNIRIPVMILQGSADTVVDPDGAILLHERISSLDKTLKIYSGLFHEIHNEPEHPEVLADVAAWLDERLH